MNFYYLYSIKENRVAAENLINTSDYKCVFRYEKLCLMLEKLLQDRKRY